MTYKANARTKVGIYVCYSPRGCCAAELRRRTAAAHLFGESKRSGRYGLIGLDASASVCSAFKRTLFRPVSICFSKLTVTGVFELVEIVLLVRGPAASRHTLTVKASCKDAGWQQCSAYLCRVRFVEAGSR
eukprot:1107162-Prymnesium_polylepis.1